MQTEQIHNDAHNEVLNTKDTVLPELNKCYMRLMELPGSRNERISGVLPFYCDEAGHEYAVSVIEREFSGSESFALFVYELCEPSGFKSHYFERELVDGRQAKMKLTNLIFSNRCNYDELHELCAMIDISIDNYYASNIFRNG